MFKIDIFRQYVVQLLRTACPTIYNIAATFHTSKSHQLANEQSQIVPITLQANPRGKFNSNLLRSLTVLLMVLMIFPVFKGGLLTAASLTWPFEADLFRDIGAAQSMLNGEFFLDPIYLGEKAWYPFLVPSLVALFSYITGVPVPTAYTQAGAYLNLLGPISFAIMMWYLFGKKAAIAGLAGFLYLVNGFPYDEPTYCPWLFPINFMQAFFYLGIAGIYHLFKRNQNVLTWILMGSFVGICFLGHPASALILAVIITGISLRIIINNYLSGFLGEARGISLKLIACGASALIVSLPMLWPAFNSYHMKIRNLYPSTYQASILRFSNVSEFWHTTPKFAILVALIGAYFLFRKQNEENVNLDSNLPIRKYILAIWIAASTVFFIWSFIASYAFQRGLPLRLPTLVPSYHFYFYIKAAQIVLFGYGFARLFEWLIINLPRFSRLSMVAIPRVWGTAVFGVLIILIVLPDWVGYIPKNIFGDSRDTAIRVAMQQDRVATYQWISDHTKPNDVFLITNEEPLFEGALFVVSPAARKVIVSNEYFSNPYIDWQTRVTDRKNLLDSIQKQDANNFHKLAAKYHLSYIMLTKWKNGDDIKNLEIINHGHTVFEQGRFLLFQLAQQ